MSQHRECCRRLALPLLAAGQQRDWANYGRYAAANAALTTAPAVVFMGNSITDGWDNAHRESSSPTTISPAAESAARSRPRCSAASAPT